MQSRERRYFQNSTIKNESLHEISNDNGLRVVKLSHQKGLSKVQFSQHCNIYKYTWTAPDGKTYSQ
jgi:hypothetical protein